MAITGDALLIKLRYELLGQNCETDQYYTPGGAAFLTANCDGVGEAWWNNVKDRWRAMLDEDAVGARFVSVVVEEFNGSGGLGEFAIPPAEQLGTRPTAGANKLMPSYVALGVRLSVPTRLTRPGQKRIPFLLEADVTDNVVGAEFILLAEDLMPVYSEEITLGAPVALGVLVPKIIHYPSTAKPDYAEQDVTGFVINTFVTSQVSRRHGHGS